MNRIVWMVMAFVCQRPYEEETVTVVDAKEWARAHPDPQKV